MWHRFSTIASRRNTSVHVLFDGRLLRVILNALHQRGSGFAHIVAALKDLDRRKNEFKFGLRLHVILCLGHRVYNIRGYPAVAIRSK